MIGTNIRKLSAAYKAVFGQPEAVMVINDLAKFCGAEKSAFRTDTHEMARMEGRREVWLRLQAQLNLSEKDIFDLLRRSGFNNNEENE